MPISPTDVPVHPAEPPSFRAVLDQVSAFIYTTDRNGCYTYANRMVLELLGHPLEDVLGKDIGQFFDLSENDSLRETDRRVLQDGETVSREEVNLIRATGELRTYWSIKEPLRDASGAITGMLGISYDITENKRLEDEVRKQKKLLGTILDNIDALVYMKDANRRFLYANQHAAEALGHPVEQIAGRLDSELLPQAIADEFWAKDQKILQSGQRLATEASLPDATGRMRHYWSIVVPWSSPDGTPAVIGLSTDITELHELKEELQRQAATDSLTGIANRRSFHARAESEFARSRRHGTPLSLVAIDIDHFKQINDLCGHLAGDRVLRNFAGWCQSVLRTEDLCGRTGGEEFCILLPETDIDAAHALAERIRNLTNERLAAQEHPALRVTASFGVASQSAEDRRFEDLFSRADRALYLAKQQGRDRTALLRADSAA
ncbi:MAG: diguanylate cyclase [Proteobacteria bacterium]|nr:diguanylate cyclase [Pseudomonadota bacterium]